MGLFAKLFGLLSNSANTACIILFFDEPECPKSIIEK